MKLKVTHRGKTRGWQAEIWNEEEILITSPLEARPGCAMRSALNEFQMKYGDPHTHYFEFSLDEW